MGKLLMIGLAGAGMMLAGCFATASEAARPAAKHMPALEGEARIAAFLKRLPPSALEMLAVPAPPPQAMEAPVAADASSGTDSVVVTGTAVAGEPSITNTQEAGVDEGGIVKRRGDHLVILRRGRLFSASIADGGLKAVHSIDAFPPDDDDTADTWYDEMLVEGDQVVVIGYSYGDSGTEVSRFTLSPEGRFTYRGTHYLTSGDYYSSRNYASRLIGDELLFYAPMFIDDYTSGRTPCRWCASG